MDDDKQQSATRGELEDSFKTALNESETRLTETGKRLLERPQ